MKEPGRNEPCWCGSGKKYKNCHWNREAQQKIPFWEIQTSAKKLLETKTCLHPLAGATCRPPMVRAHTVRRSADLKAIARDGHVYRATADFKTLDQTGGRIVPKLIGTKSASTFWGFCQTHDTSTFAPLETQPLVFTDEQAFLLMYRALSMELYLKQRQLEGLDLMRTGDKGFPLTDQQGLQRMVDYMEAGTVSAVTDLKKHKTELDRFLLASDYSEIRYTAFHLNQAPELMCSGVVQPQYTFNGRAIQNLGDLSRTSRFISFSLLSTDTGGAGVFTWPLSSDKEASLLVDSLLQLFKVDIPEALVRFALSNLENTYMSPEWWESLPTSSRESLTDRINHAVTGETDPMGLVDDGIKAVNWKVTGIQQKRA